MPNLRLASTSNSSFKFVDPSNFNRAVTLGWSVQRKAVQLAAGSPAIYNARWELTDVDRIVVPGSVENRGMENVSIKTSVSGSVENKAAVLARLNNHIANLQVIADNMASGLPPELSVTLSASAGG